MAYTEITSAAELRELLGTPSGRAVTKERSRLHALDREWLAVSPFCVLATCDAAGNCDASPKGDPAGQLVHVLDDPHVGIISMIPGRTETLRINGRARLLRDAPFFARLEVRGHRPILALLVEIDTIFFHCAKAFMRSELWRPETWQPGVLPSHAAITKAVQETSETLDELEDYYSAENYAPKLYAKQT
jgi:uncharacterized protein